MKIGFIGDIILSPDIIVEPDILDRLQSTELNVANLEAPFITASFHPERGGGGLFQLTMSPGGLHKLNIRAVSLANNHMFDYGIEGLRHTIALLDQENISWFGAGLNLKEAASILEINVGGQKIGLGGYVSEYLYPYLATDELAGIAPLRLHDIKDALENTHATVKILYNHWNQEFENFPDPLYLDLSNKLIDYCDCIVGSHPHNVQGIKKVGNKLIFNSIGNFSIPHTNYGQKYLKEYPQHAYQSLFIILEIYDGRITGHEIVPFNISAAGNRISAMSELEKELFFQKLTMISDPLDLQYDRYYSFFRKHKYRRLRPTLGRNENKNRLYLWLSLNFRRLVNVISTFFAWFFGLIGIRTFVREKLAFILNRVFKA